MERQIGATALRQKLTDVIQVIKEERATYIVETFGRPQVAIVDLDHYRSFMQYQSEREEFFRELDAIAAENAKHNADLSEEEVLAIIDESRKEVWEMKQQEKRVHDKHQSSH